MYLLNDKNCIGCKSNLVETDSMGYECKICGLKFNTNQNGINYVTTYVDKGSLYFEHFKQIDYFQTMPIYRLNTALLPFEKRLVRQLFKNQQWNSLVDLGCGTGRFLRSVEANFEVSRGFEVAAAIVDRLKYHGRDIVQGGIEEFLIDETRPNVVTLLEVIEHLSNPRELIQRIFNTKNPDLIAVVVPMWEIRRKFDHQFTVHDRPPNHLSWWDKKSLESLLDHPSYSVSVEIISEKRLSLFKLFIKNIIAGTLNTSYRDWFRAFIDPPAFWILGLARKNS